MPKIQFKTITQQAFELDFDDNATISQVKEQIAETKGKDDYPIAAQKLIFNGKVLEDTQTVSQVNVTSGKFIVVMVMKKPVIKPSANTQATSTSAAADSKNPNKEASPAGTPAAEKKKSASPSTDRPSTPTFSAEQTKIIDDVMTMGYPREEVIRACQAAFFNADRAVEYLCTGIPEGLTLNPEQVGDGDEEDVPEGSEGLAFLANSPQFQQLREMVRANPNTLPQIVQQIAETNPQLMELIRNQQGEFLDLLNAQPAGIVGGNVGSGQPAPVGGGPAGNIPGGGGPQRVAIPITPEDRAAIDRLMSMGFPEPLVIEAYLACDKNEDLAVNYILQRMDEMHQ